MSDRKMESKTHAGQPISFRFATRDDIPVLIALLRDDDLGRQREADDAHSLGQYEEAFARMSGQPGNRILLGLNGDEIVGMLQLTIIHGLTHQGRSRAQIEGVRVKGNVRGQGYGKQLFQQAFDIGKAEGCFVAQLTTDNRRADARRFYESLGFQATHHGMKRSLCDEPGV
ncbi:GNAT family N-acetyltransferase [Herbaspirillum sp. WKF16]|jgi:ribosomal protein S18 acetylase RimI-like enzyme|uniref:GNAT family N-acetyltransferase n=1 Tax=Herbaspirillum sp. WKF16 TaxID=3028312 RepID=UPI0023A9B535|nr:GNAT family N-acetyltransferase [Herbaspirillum sp. WKF16]WDZ96232.1 GNAT family N-acetyltransferase [Herbaspirillum sp. WKF16]